jgi:3-hydroxy-9,10-secoandrosta-1,3,5(10)-triene-9,17-dione monooxygenase
MLRESLYTTHGRAHGEATYIVPLLDDIAAQAQQADSTRSISADLIKAIKRNDIMRLTASAELSGLNESYVGIANELRAIAPRCSSTAWVIWNHLCLFHHFCALFGPQHLDFLTSLSTNHQWVCQGAGAGTSVNGTAKNDHVVVNGVTAFGTGCRYADWTGITIDADAGSPDFAMVRLDHPNVRIDPTWEAMSVRASATDHIYFNDVEISVAHIVPWHFKDRVVYRDPTHPVIHQRYREDWAVTAVMWLGAMASGVAETSLIEMAEGIKERIAIFGTKMVERPTIHVNIGRARSLIDAATDTVYAALRETDARIAAQIAPTEGDYFRQASAGMQAIQLCDEAMKLILRVLGGNGLREGTDFERRYRDFQAMPLHILAHTDRITEQHGRITLGLESQNPF